MADSPAFSQLLRNFRLRSGLTQRELASRADVSTREISDLERGVRRSPYLPTVNALAAALELTAAESDAFAASVAAPAMSAPSGARRAQHRLPLTLSSFLGRSREMNEVATLITEGSRLVTLTGMPGAGKTRLALETARSLSDVGWQQCVFVDVAEMSSPRGLWGEIASALRGGADLLDATKEDLSVLLANEQALIVLDGMEAAVDATGDLVELLAVSPGLSVLATSNCPLMTQREAVFEVAPLPAPPAASMTSRSLIQYAAVQLFVERTQSGGRDFSLTDENAGAVAEVVRRLDGLPLAIEMAAAQMRLFTAEELLAALAEPLSVLEDGPADLPPRQRSIRDELGWCCDHLDTGVRAVLPTLCAIEGAWRLDAAQNFLGLAGVRYERGEELGEAIEELVRHHLLLRETEAEMVYYRFPLLVRQYGLTLLREQDRRRGRARRG